VILVYFAFFWHIFFPLNQFSVITYTQKPEDTLQFGKFRQLDQKEQFVYLTSLADKKGLSYSWHYFVSAYTENSEAASLQPNEHFIAHQMGELIYNKTGFPGLTICTPDFGFGCYHGFLDKAFSKDLSGLPQAVSGCEKLGPAGSGKFESCAHGIGHGVASYYLVSDLPSALKACETLSAGQISCVDGVFMEFATDATLSFYKKSNPLYPCDAVDKKYTRQCGRYQPTVMEKMGMSKKDIASACFSSSDNNFQFGCFDALAFKTTYESGGDPNYIINQCSQMLQVVFFKDECLKAAAGEWVFQNMPGWRKTPFLLCDAISDEGKTACYQYVRNIIQAYR